MITLSSDFGSPYPAAMKGVIASRTDARLVDVAHDFPRQDVRTAAFWLREILPTFPPAVHLVVVDPGVGTDRAALAVRAGEHALVGPDNGVLVPAARALAGGRDDPDDPGDDSDDNGDDPDCSVSFEPFEITGFDPASSTFHGRDVFAPAAAVVHEAGIEAFDRLEGDRFEPVDDLVDLRFPTPSRTESGAVGEVLTVDGFGNTITNVPGDALASHLGERVIVDGESVTAARTYAEVPPGRRLVTVGSHGNVELAVNRGRGDESFGVDVGDEIRFEW